MIGVIPAPRGVAAPFLRQLQSRGSALTLNVANCPSRTAIQILAPGRGLRSTRRDAKSQAPSCAARVRANRARVPALRLRECSQAESRTIFLRGAFDA